MSPSRSLMHVKRQPAGKRSFEASIELIQQPLSLSSIGVTFTRCLLCALTSLDHVWISIKPKLCLSLASTIRLGCKKKPKTFIVGNDP